MFKKVQAVLLTTAVLAGCSAATGPTFSAFSVTRPNGEKAFRVTCLGLAERASECYRRAQDICGNQQIRPLEDVAPLGQNTDGRPDTRSLTFQCGMPPAPPQPAPPQPAPMPAPVPVPQKLTLSGDANFDFNKATLRPDAYASLNKLIGDAHGTTFNNVTVNGYTDAIGSNAYNMRLSQARANTVATYLRDHGLHSSHFTAQGFGKSNPVATNATAAGRAQNRRVEIQLDQN